MDWKLVIAIYYCFRILQAANVSMADIHDIVIDNFSSNCGVAFGGTKRLCENCISQSQVYTIHPTQLLFVNLTFTSGSETINITIQTKKEENTDFLYSRTRSFNSLVISFTLAVPKDHRYVKVILAGVECIRVFEAVHIRYYSVPEQEYLLTVFPASYVPSQSEERLVVDGQCASNADGHPKEPTMTIYSNGTVVREGLCQCKPGFQLNGTICAGCPESKYKNQIGNEPCLSCFPNTTRRSDGTGCDCGENFYRAAGQQMNFSSICYGNT